jgi:S1-C subfamily serine protease
MVKPAEGKLTCWECVVHRTIRAAWLVLAIAVLAASPLLTAGIGLARGPESVADIAESLQETVVNVSTTQTLKESKEEGGTPTVPGPKGSPFEQFFDDFFDDEQKGGLAHKVSCSAPASSSIRPGSSSPTITSSKAPTRSSSTSPTAPSSRL